MSSQIVTIRPYQERDEEPLVALWSAVLPATAPHNDARTSLRQKRAYEQELLWVAQSAGDQGIVGALMAGYDGHRGWLYSVAVHPDHQRKGIGEALVRHAEAALKARGCLKINLQVRASNSGVVRFYEKMGYKVEEILSLGKRLTL